MIGNFLKKGARLGAATARFLAREIKERVDSNPGKEEPGQPETEYASVESSGSVGLVEATKLNEILDAAEPPLLLDCREQVEWEAGYIVGSIHIPYGELEDRIGELDPARETVVYCLHGMRSTEVARWLESKYAFTRVSILDGGIISWYADLDQTRIRVVRAEERDH
jgi:adenylyltransferase/sulfurtransferase